MAFNPLHTSLCLALDAVIDFKSHTPSRLEKKTERACLDHGHPKEILPIVLFFSQGLQDVIINTPNTCLQVTTDVMSKKQDSDTYVAMEMKRLNYLIAARETRNIANANTPGYLMALPQILKKQSLVKDIFVSSKMDITTQEADYLFHWAEQADALTAGYKLPFAPPIQPTLSMPRFPRAE